MTLIDRYKRLSFWNKVAFWGSLASIMGLAAIFWPLGKKERGDGISVGNATHSAVVHGTGNVVTVNNFSPGSAQINPIQIESAKVIPALPKIIIETLDGLPPECTNNPHWRLHRLVVVNSGEAPIENFCSRLQLPEAISQTIETNSTTAAVIGWRPLLDRIIVKGTGGRADGGLWIGPTSKVTFLEQPMAFFPKHAQGERMALCRAGDLTGVWELTIDKLPPNSRAFISFLTSNGPEGTNYFALAAVPVSSLPRQNIPDTNELRFSLEGEYQYPAEAKPGRQHFIVPIKYDADQRTLWSLPIQAENPPWKTVTLVFQ